MIGDKLVITDYHRAAARQIAERVPEVKGDGPLVVTVAAESGAGKSETAYCLAKVLEGQGMACIILGQDDFFKLPPKSNHARRLADISWVGPGEVHLDVMDATIASLKSGSSEPVPKPLVVFEEDRITEELLDPGPYDAIIAEGTYTTLLENADLRAFIDRDYHQTKKARLTRARDPDTQFLEDVLEIEHRVISAHKERADVVIPAPPEDLEA